MKPQDLTPEAYHELAFDATKLPDIDLAGPVSASILSAVKKPIPFLLGVKKGPTKAMDHGNLVDCMWLTPDLVKENYAIIPENAEKKPTQAQIDAPNKTPLAQKRIDYWNNFRAAAGNRIIVDQSVLKEAQKAVSMLNQHPLAHAIFRHSAKQVALVGESPLVEGVLAKCLIDLLPLGEEFADAIVDLKTTNSLETDAITRTMWQFEYPMKIGYYGMNAEAAGFGPRPRGIIIWQNSNFPYDVRVTEIDPADMELGRRMCVDRMNKLLSMDASKLSDQYDTKLSVISLTQWQKNAIDLEDEELVESE